MTSAGPVYLLAGGPGSHQPDPLLVEALQGAARPAPSIAYLGSASGDDHRFFSWMAASLEAAGAGTVVLVPTVKAKPDMAKIREVLSSSDLVFVSGGDVEEGMSVLAKRNLVEPLRALHRGGKPFIGVSAGSIMLCREWVRWTDPDDESTAQRFDCLGICPVVCDTHAEEDDWVELKALLTLTGPGTKGYGISSGSGMVVRPSGRTIMRGNVATYANRSGRVFSE